MHAVTQKTTMMATPQQKRVDLMALYNLTPDILNKKVENKDISKLSSIIIDWNTIATQLLKRVDRENIDEDGQNTAQKKRMMLATWCDRMGDEATFDKLITAMVDTGELDQAARVCKLLNCGQYEWETLSYRLPNA